MIRRITDKAEIPLNENHCSGKINAYLNAYGTDYDFCRFYKAENAVFMVFNNNLVCDGETDEEILSFVMLNGLYSAEGLTQCPDGYEQTKRYLMKKTHSVYAPPDSKAVTVNERKEDVFNILAEAFSDGGEIDHDLWYVDISHRIRHGISTLYLYENSTLTLDFICKNTAYISDIATAPNVWRKGCASALIEFVYDELMKKSICPYVICEKELVGFYEKCGFEIYGEDMFISE